MSFKPIQVTHILSANCKHQIIMMFDGVKVHQHLNLLVGSAASEGPLFCNSHLESQSTASVPGSGSKAANLTRLGQISLTIQSNNNQIIDNLESS